MKNSLRNYSYWLTGAILAAGIAQPASANGTIEDQYVGAYGGSYGDVVGSSQFEIYSMDVDLTGSTLDATINTNFAGTAGTNFEGITVDSTGIGYGDLFLSTDGWDPAGTSPYSSDNNINGEFWEYALVIDDADRFVSGFAAGGTLSLYELTGDTNDKNARLSDDFITSGTGSYRNTQEVAADLDAYYLTDSSLPDTEDNRTYYAQDTGVTGTWSVVDGGSNPNYIVFNIDLSGTGLESTNFAFHWAMTCANDVIEGVPAPVILLLMATGLFGVGVSTAVRRKRA